MSDPQPSGQTLLCAEEIWKQYDGIPVLRQANFAVTPGEVHALMGENGAGKSTLAKIIAGAVRPDAGQIRINGRPVLISNPQDAQRHGVAMIFQELDLFPNLTVAENIVIGGLRSEGNGWVRARSLDQFCRPYLDQVGLTCRSDIPLHTLPIGHMQLVAIARALSMDARLILMDEPTSSLSDDAVDRLFRLIRELKGREVSVVFVSHKMDEIFRICDRVTVLRDGETVGTRTLSETSVDQLITMMVGRELKDSRTARPAETCTAPADVILSVSGLATGKLCDVSFDLHRGEVLGVAGLVGAGRSELGQALFGLDRLKSGTIRLNGRPFAPASPADAIRSGLGLLPEDRKQQGLLLNLGVLENSTLAILDRFQSLGFIRPDRERIAVTPIYRQTALTFPSYTAPVKTLSGGNQQKVLLSKWLLADPDVIYLDDPTRGVDVAAKRDIYEIISNLANRGKGVLLVSSELPELLRCCDRIMVLHQGRNAGIVNASESCQEEIMALATGASCLSKLS